jgi:hypothetical protein
MTHLARSLRWTAAAVLLTPVLVVIVSAIGQPATIAASLAWIGFALWIETASQVDPATRAGRLALEEAWR